MIDKILIATDDTPAAMPAADLGIDPVRSLGTTIGTMYVIERSTGNMDGGTRGNGVDRPWYF